MLLCALPSQVPVVTAKVALKATSRLDVDTSDFLHDFKEGMVEELAYCTLDEEALFRVLIGEEAAGVDLQRKTRASYETLKEFMDKEERMKRVSDGKGGMVWVRNENVQQWKTRFYCCADR